MQSTVSSLEKLKRVNTKAANGAALCFYAAVLMSNKYGIFILRGKTKGRHYRLLMCKRCASYCNNVKNIKH